jgi:hypothetical protein
MAAPTEDKPVSLSAQQADAEAEQSTESCLEIPGSSVHPARLAAMLRIKFGFGAYRITVSTNSLITAVSDDELIIMLDVM